MHVLIAGLYGVTFWLSMLGASIIIQADWVMVLMLGPIIIPAAMMFLWVLDWLIWSTWGCITRTYRAWREQN